VLPPENRLRLNREHRGTVRHGARFGGRLVVVHVLGSADGAPSRAGFVVSRAVGGAVTRNAVRRRLRHLVRDRLDRLPAGSRIVIRAQPEAATVSSAQLAGELDAALDRLSSHWTERRGVPKRHERRGARS
jgi:ribonuclease P protein component